MNFKKLHTYITLITVGILSLANFAYAKEVTRCEHIHFSNVLKEDSSLVAKLEFDKIPDKSKSLHRLKVNLIHEGFQVNSNGELLNINRNKVLGHLALFNIKSIFRWSNQSNITTIKQLGHVTPETMQSILENGIRDKKGLNMGPGLYFSIHNFDTVEYGNQLLSFDLPRSILVLVAPFGSTKNWSDDVVFRLAGLGIDAVTVRHFHEAEWFSFINSEALDHARIE